MALVIRAGAEQGKHLTDKVSFVYLMTSLSVCDNDKGWSAIRPWTPCSNWTGRFGHRPGNQALGPVRCPARSGERGEAAWPRLLADAAWSQW
jgi:hypothetical protein